MYLITLDDAVSNDVLETLYESNVRLTTTKGIKESCYPNNIRVLDLERLIEICQTHAAVWDQYDYNEEQIQQKKDSIRKQMEKHQNHSFILDYYDRQLASYE